jgi:hypothetical protein
MEVVEVIPPTGRKKLAPRTSSGTRERTPMCRGRTNRISKAARRLSLRHTWRRVRQWSDPTPVRRGSDSETRRASNRAPLCPTNQSGLSQFGVRPSPTWRAPSPCQRCFHRRHDLFASFAMLFNFRHGDPSRMNSRKPAPRAALPPLGFSGGVQGTRGLFHMEGPASVPTA